MHRLVSIEKQKQKQKSHPQQGFQVDLSDASGNVWPASLGLHPLKQAMSEFSCRVSGSLMVHRVGGQLHFALGSVSVPQSINTWINGKIVFSMEINSFHFIIQMAEHTHKFTLNELLSFNSSHLIHNFSFGPKTEGGVQTHTLNVCLKDSISAEIGGNLLGGVSHFVKSGQERISYFLKIVPVTYLKNSKVLHSYEYSVTELFHPLALGDHRHPGFL